MKMRCKSLKEVKAQYSRWEYRATGGISLYDKHGMNVAGISTEMMEMMKERRVIEVHKTMSSYQGEGWTWQPTWLSKLTAIPEELFEI